MSRSVLILRPQPGADATAARARSLGLTPVVAPLFVIRPLPWTPPPPGGFEAVMLTSANAARNSAEGLKAFLHLPCYAVGEATAIAARAAGFAAIRAGASDGAALVREIEADGVAAVLHPCGRDRTELPDGKVRMASVPVYAADAVDGLPGAAADALREGAVALIHSPRAGAIFADLVGGNRSGIRLAAISAAAAAAAGKGWREVAVADAPRDEALLELAAKLCQTAAR